MRWRIAFWLTLSLQKCLLMHNIPDKQTNFANWYFSVRISTSLNWWHNDWHEPVAAFCSAEIICRAHCVTRYWCEQTQRPDDFPFESSLTETHTSQVNHSQLALFQPTEPVWHQFKSECPISLNYNTSWWFCTNTLCRRWHTKIFCDFWKPDFPSCHYKEQALSGATLDVRVPERKTVD